MTPVNFRAINKIVSKPVNPIPLLALEDEDLLMVILLKVLGFLSLSHAGGSYVPHAPHCRSIHNELLRPRVFGLADTARIRLWWVWVEGGGACVVL